MKNENIEEYFDGDRVLLRKKNLERFLEQALLHEQDLDDEEEHIKYIQDENNDIRNQLKDLQDEDYVCLYLHPMSGWWSIRQDDIEDLLKEMEYLDDLDELKGVLKSNVEMYLTNRVENFYENHCEGTRVITYKEMVEYIYNDIQQDYELIDRLCENVYNEMMREVKIAVSHCDSVGNLENRFDLQAYIIM